MQKQKENLIERLEDAIIQLDYNKASWINKHVVIVLQDKCQLLFKSLIVLENEDLKITIETTKEFLEDVESFIESLNNGKV